MNQQQFNAAIMAGLYLTNSTALVPTAHARGTALLEELLVGLKEGKIGLAPVMHGAPTPPSPATQEDES